MLLEQIISDQLPADFTPCQRLMVVRAMLLAMHTTIASFPEYGGVGRPRKRRMTTLADRVLKNEWERQRVIGKNNRQHGKTGRFEAQERLT